MSTTAATWSWTVDTLAPGAPVLTDPTEGQTLSGSGLTISGTAEAGSKVNVSIDGHDGVSATTANSGMWSVTVSTALDAGTHTLKATATDAAGNTSVESEVRTFTVSSPSVVGDKPAQGCGCVSFTGDPSAVVMALAGLAAFVSRRRRR